jgi:hypothetical protein
MRVGHVLLALPALCFSLQCVSQVLATSATCRVARPTSAMEARSDSTRTSAFGPLLTHYRTAPRHSITSSVVASSVGGTIRPSTFAVLRLMTSSNLVNSSTGRSAGLVPFKILST